MFGGIFSPFKLPDGYTVEQMDQNLTYSPWAIYFNGKLLGSRRSKSDAHDAVVNHFLDRQRRHLKALK